MPRRRFSDWKGFLGQAEVFITNALMEIMPVLKIDGHAIESLYRAL